ncbi:hypothetical protein LCGC14_1491870 [marine sediment metagenome]|uniref:Uncharacterized protein n=1 Tax=marine sediment metagenome TaxID=412755 RepID=A0A0F9M894_9ZZZZ
MSQQGKVEWMQGKVTQQKERKTRWLGGWEAGHASRDGKVEELRKACKAALDGFHFTREYVGEEMLPAIEGWSWYDAVTKLEAALKETPNE